MYEEVGDISSKAQVSMEYLMIFSIAFAMTLPLIIIYVTQIDNVSADITHAESYRVASKIADYCDEVYFLGAPSQRTITLTFPEGISSVTLNNKEIIFNITTTDRNYQIVKETYANVTGNIKSFPGQHVLVFRAESDYVIITDR